MGPAYQLAEDRNEGREAPQARRRQKGTVLMPVSEYYKGEGDSVMADMKKRYGDKAGERVFYATANKRGMNRPGKKKGSRKKMRK
jgi:hypothetical protein